MRNNIRNEAMSANYNNNVTEAIDAQAICAPQYGVMGTPPKFDPPPQGKIRRLPNKGRRLAQRRQKIDLRTLRTKDLKMCRNILQAELTLVSNGEMVVTSGVKHAMEARLKLMIAEMTRRNLRDLANGKCALGASFYSKGNEGFRRAA